MSPSYWQNAQREHNSLHKPTHACLPAVYTLSERQNKILLDGDQSNVLLARVTFSCILLSAFSFLSTCIRDPASIWDRSNIIQIVTGVEVVIGNCLTVYLALLSKYGASKIMGSRHWPFGGHVTSSITWQFDSRRSTSYGWSITTMRLSSTVMEIWPFEVLPWTEVGRWSVLNITLISYTPLRYIRNVAREEQKPTIFFASWTRYQLRHCTFRLSVLNWWEERRATSVLRQNPARYEVWRSNCASQNTAGKK